MARFPIIAVRTHFDPRSKDEPWTAYSSEASKALQTTITERGPGAGFHECLNFAFDHPDNVPDLHLYLPPNCLPSPKTTDTTNLLILIFTYKEGEQGPYPAHLVAVVGGATVFKDTESGDLVRKKAGKKYGEPLIWSVAADPDLACVLVEPLPMSELPLPTLSASPWGVGMRYLEPDEARQVLELARDNAEGHVEDESDIAAAAVRQAEVLDRLLDAYEPSWDTGTTKPPASTVTKRRQRKLTTGRVGALVPDDIAGRKAEELVYRMELKRVAKLVKAHGLIEKASQLVVWWRKAGREHEPYDIESTDVDDDGELVKFSLEVKSSRAKDFSTVCISSIQVRFAERAAKQGHRHSFVFVRTGDDGKPIRDSVTLYTLDEVRPWLEPTEYRVNGKKWSAKE